MTAYFVLGVQPSAGKKTRSCTSSGEVVLPLALAFALALVPLTFVYKNFTT